MKKILTMMAVSLMTFGLLYAETETPTPTLVESFTDFMDEGATWASPYNIYEVDTTGAYLWYTAGTEGWVITNETGDSTADFNLSLETAKGKPLFRTVADLGAPLTTGAEDTRTMKAVDTGAEGIVVDTKIQFTGFEENPVPTADDKILVWMKAVDAEEDETGELTGGETNLYVTARVVNEDNSDSEVAHFMVTNVAAVVGQEYQVTIKSVGNIVDGGSGFGSRLGFLVYINGTLVNNESYYIGNVEGSLTAEALSIKNYLFPSMVANDLTLKAAGFEGTGTIDDLGIAAGNNNSITPVFARNYTVTFNANLPAGTTDTFTVPNDVKVISGFPIDDPQSEGAVTVGETTYNIVGWATTAVSTELYDFEDPITGNLELFAIWKEAGSDEPEIPEIAPGSSEVFEDIEEAEAVAAAINDNKAQYIIAPTGFEDEVLSKYLDMFEAVVLDGTTTVAIQLKKAAEEALKAEANSETMAEAIISAVLSEKGTLSIKGEPGFYYSVSSRGDLSTGAFVEGERKMAGSDRTVPDITLPKYTGKGFYKLNINIKPDVTE